MQQWCNHVQRITCVIRCLAWHWRYQTPETLGCASFAENCHVSAKHNVTAQTAFCVSSYKRGEHAVNQWSSSLLNWRKAERPSQAKVVHVPRSKNHWNILKHTETEVRSRGDKLHQPCSTPFAINSQVSQVSQVAFDASGCFLMSFDVFLMSFALPAKRHSAGSC